MPLFSVSAALESDDAENRSDNWRSSAKCLFQGLHGYHALSGFTQGFLRSGLELLRVPSCHLLMSYRYCSAFPCDKSGSSLYNRPAGSCWLNGGKLHLWMDMPIRCAAGADVQDKEFQGENPPTPSILEICLPHSACWNPPLSQRRDFVLQIVPTRGA